MLLILTYYFRITPFITFPNYNSPRFKNTLLLYYKKKIYLLKNLISAPILFILKKDKRLRLYIDYRGLNKIIIKNRYSLLLVNKTLNRFGGAVIFIILNLKNIYYYIKIKKEYK
jgi:hypothetical protein